MPILSLPVCAVQRAVPLEPQMACGCWIVRSPSRLSKCPRSRVHRVLPVCLFLRLRWRNSCWKCRRRSASSSRTPTFQFRVVVVLEEVFKVFTPNRVQQRLSRSRSLTLLSMVEAFVAFSQDRVQQRSLHRLPTFPLPVEVFKVFSQNSIQQHGLRNRTFLFQFRVVVAEVVEVFKVFAHNRVQIVDIPTSGGPHGFLPRHGSAASAAENVEFPAGGGLHGSRLHGVFWT